ncbi:polysaccharide deacetylase family protein [Alteromonas halophila]|uniref:Polysaccharide deacetylase n=1 Tax=Alteromonas halophila TaxID=516698 RepID=A0A918MZY2_9ALTE|nr:polysaccharide deacetylase family protein [Alteromonas halophila]GGW91012.1 polysaccharide deacetylase [Alteromonas halophila]
MKSITRWGQAKATALFVLLFVVCTGTVAKAEPLSNAVILIYHHVAKDTPASTSVTPDTFKKHMAFLDENYNVLSLKEVMPSLKAGEALPDRTVVITFDDGFANILENAHPVLREYGFPYTVFINPGEIGSNPSQLTWQQVQKMQEEGAIFANHTLNHMHMLEKSAEERDDAWLVRVWDNVAQAEEKLKEKTGESLKYLAYPFGEFNQALADKVTQEGYTGFAQHSGAVGPHSNFAALPRFPAAGIYADLDKLKIKLDSLAMPLDENSGLPPQRSSREIETPLTLNITSDDVRLSQAACYYQGSALPVEVSGMTLTAELDMTLPVGRSRINCTAPSKAHSGRYYWYSQPFFIADKNGRYPD